MALTEDERRTRKRLRDAEYRAKNREKLAEKQRGRNSNPETLARRRELYHAETNEQRVRRQHRDREWRRANRERILETNARWARENPERHRENCLRKDHARRARMRAAIVEPFTQADVTERYGTDCYICHGPTDNHRQYEHVTPLARGGEHSIRNVRWAHGRCNRLKADSLWLGPIWWGYLPR